MADVKCRLCLNNCLTENVIDIFDDKLEIDIPQLIAKYLLITVENNEDTPNGQQKYSTKICRMCFVHLLDFHYFFQLIEKQQRLLTIVPKFETIDILSDSEDSLINAHSVFTFLDDISENCDGHFHIINEADEKHSNEHTNCSTNNNTRQVDTNENDLILKMKILEDRLVLDPVNLMENKFIYDDSESENPVENDIETNNEQNKDNGNKTKKSKKKRKTNACQNSSIRDTIIRLRRRTNNIYDVVDEHGRLRNDINSTTIQKSNEISDILETYSKKSSWHLSTKKNKIKRSRSDKMTYEIIERNGHLKCDLCQTEQKTFRDLVHHFHKKHTHLRPYAVCCDKRHYSPKVLSNHILSHSNPELFKCEICNKVLGTQYSYRMHKRAKHSGKRKVFKCNICGKRLISAKYFDVHVSNHT